MDSILVLLLYIIALVAVGFISSGLVWFVLKIKDFVDDVGHYIKMRK